MDGEFNNFNINNTNITFSVATNNIETSDETTADPIYQRQMGTVHSCGKKVAKAVTITGIALTFTAATISGGKVLSNAFVTNPPTVSSPTFVVEEDTLHYSFVIKNDENYKTAYFIELNGEEVFNEQCTEAKEYLGTYSPVEKNSRVKFYVKFTNSFDYYKTIYTNEFIV